MPAGIFTSVFIGTLSAVFTAAGLAKLAIPGLDLGSWAGKRRWVPKPLVRLLSIVELTVAVALAFPSLRIAALATASALLAFFSVLTAVNLYIGDDWYCQCFGSAAPERAGSRNLLRNLLFLGVALIAMRLALTADQPARLELAGLAAAATVYWVTRNVPEESAPLKSLPLRSTAPDFRLPGLDGQPISLGEFTADTPAILLFVKGGCAKCAAIEPDIDRWAREFADDIRFLVVSTGGESRTELYRRHALVFQEGKEVATQFGVNRGPAIVLIGRAREVLSDPVIELEAVRAYLSGMAARSLLGQVAGETVTR